MLTGIKFVMLLACVMFPSSLARMPQCIQCAAGKFKSSDIFAPCTPCPENTFSVGPGAVQCFPCPPFSSSANGSSRCTFEPCRVPEYNFGCVCPVGSTGPHGGPCTPCSAGTYKNWTGDEQCSNCTGGTISRENSTSCFCPSGTSLVSGRCAQIYGESVRLSGFLDLHDANGTNSSAEINLPLLKEELTASVASLYNISDSLVRVFVSLVVERDRIAVEIYLLATDPQSFAAIVNATNTATPPMLRDVERATVPVSMNEGSFKSCGKNEVSTSDACICAAGYTRGAGKCVACAAGKVKALAGDAACDACSNNTFSRTAAVNCSTCPLTSTTKLNHTSCACNAGFVFFNDTCTPTEALYMTVSGTLQLPDGAFAASELQSILLDGLSQYLNFSKEFITITVTVRMNDTNTATPAPRLVSNTSNASNATYDRRRSLLASTVDYTFTAIFQVELNDKPTFAKIEKFVSETKSELKTITDANGYRFIIQTAYVLPGYVTDEGAPISPCENGWYATTDSETKTLVCKQIVLESTEGYWLILIAVVIALIGCLCLHYCTGAVVTTAVNAWFSNHNRVTVAPSPFPDNVKVAPMLFPATVTFEYQLLPGQSI